MFSKIKTGFLFAFLFFFVYLLPSLVIYRSHMTLLSLREGSFVQNLFFKKVVMNLFVSTRVFCKKSNF